MAEVSNDTMPGANPGLNGGIVGADHVPEIGDLQTVFTSPGSFSAQGQPQGDVLVVAGGAGNWNNSSGAGAGGVRFQPAHPLPASAVTVTVGAGGSGAPSSPYAPGQGGASSFAADTPIACVGGGSGTNDGNYGGTPGGSGAGATYGPSGASTTVGTGTTGEGTSGGNGYRLAPQFGSRGGGGGKGGAGGAAPSGSDGVPGGYGGPGTDYSPTFGAGVGESGYFGGGGAGSNSRGNGAISGGSGGGGDSPTSDESQPGPEWGLVNTGGGAGSNPNSYPGSGGIFYGGSGVVIVKQADVEQNISGIWAMQAQFTAVSGSNWPT